MATVFTRMNGKGKDTFAGAMGASGATGYRGATGSTGATGATGGENHVAKRRVPRQAGGCPGKLIGDSQFVQQRC